MDTRTHLLNTAEHLARTRGFDAFSYADLANDIGIRKASIHYHFATKGDLASAMIDRYSTRFLNQLNDISAKAGTAADDLRAYVGLYRDALDNGKQLCLCVSFSSARDSFDDVTLDHLNRFHQDSVAWLANVFDKAEQDNSISGPLARPEEEAHGVLALAEGAQLGARAARSGAPFDLAVQPLLRRLAVKNLH